MEYDFAMAGFSLNRAVATYANNKKYFVNSKLNSNLFIDENQSAPADLVIDSYSITSLNKLLNARYTESVYPASINVYRSHIRGRTNYSNDFWKETQKENGDAWNVAVEVDEKIRNSSQKGEDDKLYLHPSLVPLKDIDFDDGQLELFEGYDCEGYCGL